MATTVGRYELLRELGQGGMAEVYLARRRGPGGVEKRLALKRIRRERSRDPRLLKMFVHEARLSMALAHKNIVPMFDFGRAGDELFLVMEFIDGPDLAAALAAAGEAGVPPTALLAAFIALEACQALDYAHCVRDEEGIEREIVHRDVTPRNVLLSYSGEVKLVDFGVATNETDLGGAGKVRGTPPYMAPEQARGEQVDSRADIFSLGLVLWEMLAGRRAYDGLAKEELLAQARRGIVPRLSETVPRALRDVVERATAPELADRFESARQMQLALDSYIVTARRDGGAPPSHELSSWLAEVIAPRCGVRASVARTPGAGSAAEIVTFLGDGAAEVERIATMAAGETTMRSLAETAIESDAGVAVPPSDADSETSETRDEPSFHLAMWALVLTGVVAVVVASFYFARGRAAPSAAATATLVDAGLARLQASSLDADVDVIADAGVADAVRAVDAAASRRDARSARRSVNRSLHSSRSDAGAAAVPPGTLRISSSPWAHVSVVGQSASCSETPCKLTLPPGDYVLRLRNPVGNLAKSVSVHVQSGRIIDIVESLTRSERGPER